MTAGGNGQTLMATSTLDTGTAEASATRTELSASTVIARSGRSAAASDCPPISAMQIGAVWAAVGMTLSSHTVATATIARSRIPEARQPPVT